MSERFEITPRRVGIIGSGQLGRMGILATHDLGFRFAVLAVREDDPACRVFNGTRIINPTLKDPDSYWRLAELADYLTVELEDVNTDALRRLMEQGVKVNPHPDTLEMVRNRLGQKRFMAGLGLRAGQFMDVPDRDAAHHAFKTYGPMMIKKQEGGYDGRGVWKVEREKAIDPILNQVNERHTHDPAYDSKLYAEKLEKFQRPGVELAIMTAKGVNGVVTFPVTQTEHLNGQLFRTITPAEVPKEIQLEVEKTGKRLASALPGYGLYGLECFWTGSGIQINEMAPRPHNSGHYSIEACMPDQFETWMLAVSELPLRQPAMMHPYAVMTNLTTGLNQQGLARVLGMPKTRVHFYDKPYRPERKVGHITTVGDYPHELLEQANTAYRALAGSPLK